MLRPIIPYQINMSPYVIPGLKTDKVGRTMDLIIQATCSYYNVRLEEIQVKSRKRHLLEPRQVIMYLLYRYTNMSLRQIGEIFGNKDHATVINSRERVKDRLATVPDMNRILTRIKIKAEIEDKIPMQ